MLDNERHLTLPATFKDRHFRSITDAAHGTRTLIEGHIEAVGTDGVVLGWLRDTAELRPCHVQVLHEGSMVAEALADRFRRDLLHAGHGHGHHGFAARLRTPLPEGRRSLVLHLPSRDLSAPMALSVPPLAGRAPVAVEALLREPEGWTVQDVLARPQCLDMQSAYEAMGPERFIDGVFRFALDRWPSPPEASLHGQNLEAGRLRPPDLLLDLLSGRERADMPPALMSPYDPDFPFTAVHSAGVLVL